MSTSDRVRAALVLATLGLIALASCTLAPDHCLRMSDCDDGTSCVDGLCAKSDDSTSFDPDAGVDAAVGTTTTVVPVADSSATTASATIEAGSSDAASDSGDGAVTDAPTD